MSNKTTTAFSARKRLIVAAISACFASAPAWSNPTAPQVVNGSANFNQTGKLLTVTNSNGAIINWNTFSIGAGETTRFNQTSAASSVLNRVLANDPSVLLGTLSSNGRVWLVNPAGIMVGQGARIDVAGFIASTLNVRNEDFLAGRLNFGATPNAGKIENHGQITTPTGGSVYLVAPAVENHGIINAPNGEVVLAAGQTVQLIDSGTPGVKVDITGAEGNVTNLGEIVSEAGRIGLAGVLVKNSGALNASSLVKEGGRVFLKASQDAYVDGNGRIITTGTKGGSIEVLGNRVAVMDNASLDSSGQNGGGKVLVGGDAHGTNPGTQNAQVTYFGSGAQIRADATQQGDGGKVIVWADDTTRAYGNISAHGGAERGSGGFVETSGKRFLDVAGIKVDTSAAKGVAGNWLLDPTDITIYGGMGTPGSYTGGIFQSGGGASAAVYAGDISLNLNSTDISITTSSAGGGSGDITMNGTVDAGGAATITNYSGVARAVTLQADRDIALHDGASISGISTSPLSLTILAKRDIALTGSNINLADNANLVMQASYGGSSVGDIVLNNSWVQVGTTQANTGNTTLTGQNINLFANSSGWTMVHALGYGGQTVTATNPTGQVLVSAYGGNSAGLMVEAGSQTVSANKITLQGSPTSAPYGGFAGISMAGGMNGGGGAANVGNGTQTINITGIGGALSLYGGGTGVGDSFNNANLIQSNNAGTQIINVYGGGSIYLQGGGGLGSNNNASINNSGSGGQAINFIGAPGSITLYGGSAGSNNGVNIGNIAGSQIIGSSTYGAAIYMQGGSSGSNNSANINDNGGNQTVNATSITLTGADGGGVWISEYGNAGASTQTIHVTNALTLNGGALASAYGGGTANVNLFNGAYGGAQQINAGSITLTGGYGAGVSISENSSANGQTQTINVTNALTLNGATAGSGYGGASVNLYAGAYGGAQLINAGSITLNGGAGGGVWIGENGNADGQTQTLNVTNALTLNGAAMGSGIGSANVNLSAGAYGGAQLINAGSITLNGGDGGGVWIGENGNAAGQTETLNVTNALTLNGAATGSGYGGANVSLDAGAYGGTQQISAGSIALTGGAGGNANINLYSGGAQTISTTGALTLSGAPVASSYGGNAGIHAGNGFYNAMATQTVSAGSIVLTASPAGTNGSAWIGTYGGTQTINLTGTGGSLSLLGGGSGSSDSQDSAGISQYGPTGTQIINVYGGGSILLQGGSGLGSSNSATLSNGGSGGQAINFVGAPGSITLYGGSAGDFNYGANISSSAGSQVIGSSTYGAAIYMQGGSGGSSNTASINDNGGSQTVNATSITLTGAYGGGAWISENSNASASTQTIHVTNALTLNGGALTSVYDGGSANVNLFNGAYGGAQQINAGSITLTGGYGGGVSISENSSANGQTQTINVTNAMTLNGAAAGSGIGSANVSLNTGGVYSGTQNISAGSIGLNGGAGGNANISLWGSGAQSVVAANALTLISAPVASNYGGGVGITAGNYGMGVAAAQTVSANALTMTASPGGSYGFASIDAYGGTQTINITGTGGSLVLSGGGTAPSDYENWAHIWQSGPTGGQVINVYGGGSILLQGGNGAGVGTYGSNSNALIDNAAGSGGQAINFIGAPGSIVLYGGGVGTNNGATIWNSAGNQVIGVGGYGAAIYLQGGTSGSSNGVNIGSGSSGFQSINATGITVLGGSGGGSNGASIGSGSGGGNQTINAGSISLTGGYGGGASITDAGNFGGLSQTINVTNALTLQGAPSSASGGAANISHGNPTYGGAQQITAGSITLTAGGSAATGNFGNNANLTGNGTQIITVTGGGITLSGGGGTTGYNNSAGINQNSAFGSQAITLTASNATISLTGGSGNGLGSAALPSGCLVGGVNIFCDANLRTSNNNAHINNNSGNQFIDFQYGGSLNLTGGANGVFNYAQINNGSTGQQKIFSSGGSAYYPNITLTGGASGGNIATALGGGGGLAYDSAGLPIYLRNGAWIQSLNATPGARQAIDAGTITLTGAGNSTTYGGVYIIAPAQDIHANGDVTLTGGAGENGTGGFSGLGMTGAVMGNTFAASTDMLLNVGGDLTLIGGSGRGSDAVIGTRYSYSTNLVADVAGSISAHSGIGAYGGSSANIGSVQGYGGSVTLRSGQDIVLSDGTGIAGNSNQPTNLTVLAKGDISLGQMGQNTHGGAVTLTAGWNGNAAAPTALAAAAPASTYGGSIFLTGANLPNAGTIDVNAYGGLSITGTSTSGAGFFSTGNMNVSAHDITLTATYGGGVNMSLNGVGTQNIAAANALTLLGADSSSSPYGGHAAVINSSNGAQHISAGQISLTGGGTAASGNVTGNYAQIYSNGVQTIDVTGSGMTLQGGGGTIGSGNSATINQFTSGAYGGSQSITFHGNNASLTLTGGSGAGVYGGLTGVGSDCFVGGVNTNCVGATNSHNAAGIYNTAGNQTIDFQYGGGIVMTGGTNGASNFAEIGIDWSGVDRSGLQTIYSSKGNAPSITLSGGASGGALATNYGGTAFKPDGRAIGLNNSAGIYSDGSQTISASTIALSGGTAAYGGAYLGSSQQGISTTGDITLNGGTAAAPSTSFVFTSGAVIGSDTAVNSVLNIGGSLTVNGNSAGAGIGSLIDNGSVRIDAGRNVTLTGGGTGGVFVGGYGGSISSTPLLVKISAGQRIVATGNAPGISIGSMNPLSASAGYGSEIGFKAGFDAALNSGAGGATASGGALTLQNNVHVNGGTVYGGAAYGDTYGGGINVNGGSSINSVGDLFLVSRWDGNKDTPGTTPYGGPAGGTGGSIVIRSSSLDSGGALTLMGGNSVVIDNSGGGWSSSVRSKGTTNLQAARDIRLTSSNINLADNANLVMQASLGGSIGDITLNNGYVQVGTTSANTGNTTLVGQNIKLLANSGGYTADSSVAYGGFSGWTMVHALGDGGQTVTATNPTGQVLVSAYGGNAAGLMVEAGSQTVSANRITLQGSPTSNPYGGYASISMGGGMNGGGGPANVGSGTQTINITGTGGALSLYGGGTGAADSFNNANLWQGNNAGAQIVNVYGGGSIYLQGGNGSGVGDAFCSVITGCSSNFASINNGGSGGQTINFVGANGSISLIGGSGGTSNSASINNGAGNQVIGSTSYGASILVQGGPSGGGSNVSYGGGPTNLPGNMASLWSNGSQTIYGPGLTVLGGIGGTGNYAYISSNSGVQSLTIGSGGVQVTGGASGSNNSASIGQNNASGTQTIAVTDGSVAVLGGAASNSAQIWNNGTAQSITLTNADHLDVIAGGGSANINSQGNQTLAITGTGANLIQIGSADSAERSNIVGKNQSITAGSGAQAGAIDIHGGVTSVRGAGIFNNAGNQTVATSGAITLTGGSAPSVSGTNCGDAGSCAQIGNSPASGSQTISAHAISALGGAGVGFNQAGIYNNGSALQTVTINGTGGSIQLQGGSGTGILNNAYIGSGVSNELIDFTGSGGSISLTGGTVGNGNSAGIGSATMLNQTISGRPSITLTGGANGGIVDQANFTSISTGAAGTQNISSGSILLNAGAGGTQNFAAITAPAQIIDVAGTLTINGGGTASNAGARIGGRGTYAGGTETATNLTLTTTGDITLTGGTLSGAAIGSSNIGTAQNNDIAINGGGNIVLTSGSGGVARIGAPNGLVLGGNISVNANGNLSLTGNAANPATIQTNGNIAVTNTGSISASGAIRAGGNVTLDTGGSLTLDSGAILSASAAGDALVLAANGNFINNAGASAVSAPSGRWLVYSTDPASDVRGGIAYDFKEYGLKYSGTTYAGPGVGNGVIYSVAPSVTPMLTGTATKIYDGTTAAPLVPGNYTVTGGIDGDIVVLNNPTSGVYVDKNVGTGKSVSATVALAGASNGSARVYGYQLSGTTASGNIGQINQRPLSTWVGSTGGLWSNPANWDAIPDGANVAAVSIPAGGSYQVTYDASAGSTSLQSLNSAQVLALSGGNLTISGNLNTAGYVQSGGVLGGTGNLSVNNSFSQSGGSIGLSGSAGATITQATGDLIIRSLAAQTVALTAQGGSVSQTGPIVASALVTKSVTGTNLSDAGNQVSSFTATNSGSGNVVLTNKGTLSIAGIANSGGNITLNNTGAMTASGVLSAGGDVSVVADALNLNSGSSISAGRDAILAVSDMAATNAKISATRDIRAQVAGDLKLNDGSSLTAGNDIWLSLNGVNSTLYLNDLSGLQPSYLWANAPSTIHLDYTARTSGGLVMDGAAVDVLSYKSVAGECGLFYGPTMVPAGLDAGLDLTGILRPPVVSTAVAVEIATVTGAITTSTTAATTTATGTPATAKVEAPPPPAPTTAPASASALLLSNSNQTIGGTTDTFGGSSATPSAPATSGSSSASAPVSSATAAGGASSDSSGGAPSASGSSASASGAASGGSSDKPAADKPSEAKPAEDKSMSAKKDDTKADDKKDEDKKKKEEAAPAKKDDKPAAKKLAACS